MYHAPYGGAWGRRNVAQKSLKPRFSSSALLLGFPVFTVMISETVVQESVGQKVAPKRS